MGRRTVAAAGLSALGLTVTTAPAAPAAILGSCSWSSRVNVAPGLTFAPQDFTFTLDGGDIAACRMPNGETRTGKIVATKGTGYGGCSSSRVETPFRVVWNGRTESTGTASGVTSGPFGYVTGKLVDGEFGGTPFETVFYLDPQGPMQCGTSGITSAELYGQITFR